jgi:Tol biopolymer transport system component
MWRSALCVALALVVSTRLADTQIQRVSVASDGTEANGQSFNPSISPDGRYVAFESGATNLAADVPTTSHNVFLHDRQTGQTSFIGSGGNPRITADARYVIYTTSSGLAAYDRQNATTTALGWGSSASDDLRYVVGSSFIFPCYGMGTLIDRDTNQTTQLGTDVLGPIVISPDGRYIAYQSCTEGLSRPHTTIILNRETGHKIQIPNVTPYDVPRAFSGDGRSLVFGGISCGVWVHDHQTLTSTKATDAAHPRETGISHGGRYISYAASSECGGDGQIYVFDRTVSQSALVSVTPDGTRAAAGGTFETAVDDSGRVAFRSGAANLVPGDANGAHDIFANRGTFIRYFAEGATGALFDTEIALANPGDTTANVTLRFLRSNQPAVTSSVSVPAMSRRTVAVRDLPGLSNAEFATVIESDVAVMADRTMRWGAGAYGSHAETSLTGPASTWYLAEGATHSGFNLFYLIHNPNGSAATVQITYLLPAPVAPVTKSYVVPANSRFNIWVNNEAATDPGLTALAATDVSARVLSSQPVVLERAMYLNSGGQTFGAGHGSAGVTATATSWFLAEGATGSYFDLFVLIVNPNTETADVQARYLLPSGATVVRNYLVAGNSRRTIWVDLEDSALADTAVSATISSPIGIIVERSMWWPGPTAATWHEAHNSPGATATGVRWGLAEGEVDSVTETYILVANTSPFAGSAKVTLMFEDGGTTEKTFALNPSSRFNVAVKSEFSSANGKRFGAVVESLGSTPAQIVVERAMYSNANGVVWAAGTNALATKLQ